MMRYLVVETRWWWEHEECMEYIENEVVSVLPCADSRAVCTELNRISSLYRHDWAVFENVEGRYEKRAVTFLMDGPVKYDVEIR